MPEAVEYDWEAEVVMKSLSPSERKAVTRAVQRAAEEHRRDASIRAINGSHPETFVARAGDLRVLFTLTAAGVPRVRDVVNAGVVKQFG